ncbi:hypothetical protein OTSKARP_1077, partial [Orientia tsutsugamushi str. Karp]
NNVSPLGILILFNDRFVNFDDDDIEGIITPHNINVDIINIYYVLLNI